MSNTATFGDAKTALEVFGYVADATAEAALRASYRQILADRRWVFLTQQTTLSTVAASRDVALTTLTDLASVDAVVLTTASGDTVLLDYIDPSDERRRNAEDPTPDEPAYWTLYRNSALRLWPVPDRIYTLSVGYVQDPVDPPNDAAVLVIPHRYLDVMVWGAVIPLAYRQRDWAGAQTATAQFERRLTRMAQTHGLRQRSNSSHVGHDADFWDAAAG